VIFELRLGRGLGYIDADRSNLALYLQGTQRGLQSLCYEGLRTFDFQFTNTLRVLFFNSLSISLLYKMNFSNRIEEEHFHERVFETLLLHHKQLVLVQRDTLMLSDVSNDEQKGPLDRRRVARARSAAHGTTGKHPRI